MTQETRRHFDQHAGTVDDLTIELYDELRSLAAKYLRRESRQLMLEPAALVHEAYLRLRRNPSYAWKNKPHFFGMAALAMRHVLVDHARQRRALKGELSGSRISLELVTSKGTRDVDIREVDDALVQLAKINERWSDSVVLRFFAGQTHDQVAKILGISRKTAVKDWAAARRWLSVALSDSA